MLMPHKVQAMVMAYITDLAAGWQACQLLLLLLLISLACRVTACFFANLDKHDRTVAERNLSRYYHSICVLVQRHGDGQVNRACSENHHARIECLQ